MGANTSGHSNRVEVRVGSKQGMEAREEWKLIVTGNPYLKSLSFSYVDTSYVHIYLLSIHYDYRD